jgi:hypothetical protein
VGNLRPWKPGQSGNAAGRPAVVAEVRDLARKQTKPAIRTLTHIMHHGKTDQARVAAASALLDRAWGKPIQAIQTDGVGTLVVNIVRTQAPAGPTEARHGDVRGHGPIAPVLGDGFESREALRDGRVVPR